MSRVVFVSQAQHYAETKQAFADRPAIANGITPSSEPSELRIVLRPGRQPSAVDADLHGQPDVKTIYVPNAAKITAGYASQHQTRVEYVDITELRLKVGPFGPYCR